MSIDDARTPCCHVIPELVRGAWEPHAPNIDCRTTSPPPPRELPLLPGWQDYVDDFSDADLPGL